MKKTVVAICYDFDNTLSVSDMQSFSFIPNLGMSVGDFWSYVNTYAKNNKMDGILSYMYFMIQFCKEKGIKLTKEYLNSLGKDIEYFKGVTTWFDRINAYGNEKNIEVEHYIITSGNREIIEGSEIFDKCKEVFGCEYLYGEDGEAIWPKHIVNYTQKTQFLFRICKGAYDITDEKTVNQRIKKRHVEFRNMIYMGDGLTDVPCLTLIKEKGGNSISIYKPETKEVSERLIKENRVNFACEGDFSENSQVENLVKLIIDSVYYREKLIKKEQQLKKFN
ncbi:MAG: haloacid dehalogenase-like hydrolase [Clostridia bacterium]|nr:haloacid dehalogenase-like hydrolase [Clostridia bacterium]